MTWSTEARCHRIALDQAHPARRPEPQSAAQPQFLIGISQLVEVDNFTSSPLTVGEPSRCDVATSSSPSFATKFGSSKVASIRSMVCDCRVTEDVSRADLKMRRRNQHRPSSDLSRGFATYITRPRSVDRGYNGVSHCGAPGPPLCSESAGSTKGRLP